MRNHSAVIYTRPIHDVSSLAETFDRAGFEVLKAEDSETLYKITNSRQVDVIVIEHKLDSFLTGLEILSRLNEALVRPTTVLLGTLTDREKRAAKEASVDFLYSLEDAPESIVESCCRACRWEANRGVFIPETARMLIRDADFLQPLPQLAVKIVPYLNDETANVADLANEIAKDALATAEILRVINSSSSGIRNRVQRLSDAVALLGIKQTVTTVLRFCIQSCQSNLATRLNPELLSWFSARSTLTASTASVLAKRSQSICPDTVYLLGLLQDLGILALAHEYDSYFKIIDRYRKIPQVRLDVLEEEDYEINHAHVSAAILQRWQMPASIIRLILHHHTSSQQFDELSQMESGVIRALQIGEALSNMHDLPSAYRFQRFESLLNEHPERDAIDVRSFLSESIAKACESAELHKTPAPEPKNWDALIAAVQGCLTADGSTPAAETDPTEEPEPEDSALPQLLVFDDVSATADEIREMLNDQQIQIRHCKFPDHDFDLPENVCGILCEASFAQSQTIKLVRQLRRRHPRLSIIAISRNRTRRTVMRLIQAGITGFLARPFTNNQLRAKLSLQQTGELAVAAS